MSQSNLSAPMTKLQATVGDYLGWGRGAAYDDEVWTPNKQNTINEYVDMALRWVYFEATLDPRTAPHEWSFLNFAADLTVNPGEKYTPLPDDFGGFKSNILQVRIGGTGGVFSKIRLVGEPMIDEKYSLSPSIAGRPLFAADRARKGTTASHDTRRELYVYPVPDTTYTIRGHYDVLPNQLTSEAPYTYGGADMASCFIAACRAAAEIYKDNIQPGQGVEWPMYQRSLAAAIQRDGSRYGPKSLGRNIDQSDPSRRTWGEAGWWRDGTIVSVDPATFDGILYD